MSEQLLEIVRDELAPELELERQIGRGTTAVVYLAREPALERLVAVKVLRPDIAADQVARRRFEREARAAARIKHADVTTIHRVGALTSGVPYIVMEYLDGRTLAERVHATGALALEEAVTVLASLASALAAAHEQGILHRDVRPSNVFIDDRSGRAVLTDFGIAGLKETGSEVGTRLTPAGMQLGRIEYTSPEELRGEKVTEQSDVYAFGMLAYMAIAGRAPYDANGASEFTAAHLEGSPRPLGALRFGVDPRLASMLERCLAKEPRQRPRASDLAAALTRGGSRSGAGDPHLAIPAGSFEAFLHELRHRNVYKMAAAYGTSMLALFTLAAVLNQAYLPDRWFEGIVTVGLVGFPIALSLSWIFEIRDGRLLLTRSSSRAGTTMISRWARVLPWLGLAASIVTAGAIGWFLLFRP